MSMISLRSRLSFMKGLAPSAATRAGLSGSSIGSPADALGDLRVTVRASPPGTSYSSRSEHPVRFSGDFAGPSHGAPSISFGAPSVDRMSIAASGDGFTSSEDESVVGLPPLGVVATAAPDPELTAMLAWAAVSIGLEVSRPPSPEPSRLDYWFLGAGRGSQPRSAPVPFFPEVHEELTKSWMAPFTARSRSSASSIRTTLNSGVARGYVGIPQAVGRSQGLVLRHLSQLGLRVNLEKSKLSPVQRISFLDVELDSVSMTARLTEDRAQAVLNCLSSFRGRNVVPLKQFQRLLGHMASAAAVTPLGLLHKRPLQYWLHSWVPRWAWRRDTLRVGISQQCRRSLSPWTNLAFLRPGVPLEQVSRHTVLTTDASNTGWGATCNGQAASGLWTGPRLLWHINCLELWAVHLALRHSSFSLIHLGRAHTHHGPRT